MNIFWFKEIGKLRTRGTLERNVPLWCHSGISIPRQPEDSMRTLDAGYLKCQSNEVSWRQTLSILEFEFGLSTHTVFKVWSGEPWKFLRPLQWIQEVKSIFTVISKLHLPFSLIIPPKYTVGWFYSRLNREADRKIQVSSTKQRY